MSLRLETYTTVSEKDLKEAAIITARGFGRENDDENYRDTASHLDEADYRQLLHDEERLVAFAAYRRKLWLTRS